MKNKDGGGRHIKKYSFLFPFILFTIFIFPRSVLAATTVGQQLLQPDSGWQRIDDTNPNFTYSGSWNAVMDPKYYDSTRHSSYAANSSISFKFYGSKLRIIGARNICDSSNIQINIDGTNYYYNDYETPNLN